MRKREERWKERQNRKYKTDSQQKKVHIQKKSCYGRRIMKVKDKKKVIQKLGKIAYKENKFRERN